MKQLIFFVIASVFYSTSFCQTQRIAFKAPLAYPEGVTYNAATKLFYVSSVKTGTIGTVDESGSYKELYKDSMLKSSFGMKIDSAKNRLLVCVSDPNYSRFSTPATFKKMARVITIDLGSGKKVMDTDLSKLYPGKHFANDIALDDNGNAYISDSFSPVIYKINSAGQASVFAKSDMFKSDMFKSEDVGLNGIVYHSQGFLLAAHNTNGMLLKIDVANPEKIVVVKVETLFPGADGLLWISPDNLALVQNKGVNIVFTLTSNDNWMSAEVQAATAAEDRFQYPTTATMKEGKIWILNAKLNENADSSLTPSKEFSLQMANFRPAR